MSDFPDGYKPLPRTNLIGTPAPLDPSGEYWQKRNAQITQKNREQGARPTSLSEAFARPPVEQKDYSPNWNTMLPPNDPLRQEQMRRDFGIVDEKAEMARLQAENTVLREGLDRLDNAIRGE